MYPATVPAIRSHLGASASLSLLKGIEGHELDVCYHLYDNAFRLTFRFLCVASRRTSVALLDRSTAGLLRTQVAGEIKAFPAEALCDRH
jgi:hypothetical protein